MIKFFNKKSEDLVSSLDQLIDERARDIASQKKLNIEMILPFCSQINNEIKVNNKHIVKLLLPNMNKTNIFLEYQALLASATVLSYELSKRPSISFPKPNNSQIVGIPKFIFIPRLS